MQHCVITTINRPTRAVKDFSSIYGERLIIVGDKKTPNDWNCTNAVFIPWDQECDFALSKLIPHNHYARKNIGYLMAIKKGATSIYDTDDDNIPNGNWVKRSKRVIANRSTTNGWVNAYRYFTNDNIWPRGFPLNNIYLNARFDRVEESIESPIQQGLADKSPDVDAIWRLIANRDADFNKKRSVYLGEGSWCPFNSQSTWWFPEAYPLMYLPISATFRMTDIWRSFVAQRCLWELGQGVTFHSPSEVFQDRNEHDLMKDFEYEIPGYLNNNAIADSLSSLTLKKGNEYVCENMLTCYDALVGKNILNKVEMESVKQWVQDYEYIARSMG